MDCEKINILHVILSLEIGGMEQVVSDLVRNLDRTRFNPVIVCLDTVGPLGEELIRQGVPVIKLEPMVPVVSLIFPYELIRIIRRYGADIIHVHSGCWYKGAAAAFFTDVRSVIYTEHGRTFPDPPLTLVLDRIYSWLTSRVIAVSHDLAGYMNSKIGISKKKIGVIINGIDEVRFIPSGETAGKGETIGIVARLAPVKGIDILLRAMRIVVSKRPSSRLKIVGDGPERQALEKLAVNLGISDNVEFLGFMREIPHLLGQMDLVVLSSYSEGTSITLLEAMAAGKPVVVTSVGGNSAIVEDGKNGFLVPPGAPGELADAILRLLDDHKLRERMSAENRRKIARSFSVGAMTKAYEAVYAEAW